MLRLRKLLRHISLNQPGRVGAGCVPWVGAFLAPVLAAGPAVSSTPLATPERMVSGFEEGVRFQVPRGVALDPVRDEIVVANTGAHRIEIFSSSGRPLERFVHRVRVQDGALTEGLPHAVAVLRNGLIAVADNLSPLVDVLDRRGRFVGTVRLPSAVPRSPAALCVSPSGDLLVAGPPGDDRVYRVNDALAIVETWGLTGEAPGSLSAVTALACMPDGRVVVACAKTELAIQIFSSRGEYIRGFGRHDIGPGNFSFPSGLATSGDGRIWASDELRQVIQVFQEDGGFLGIVGGKGLAPGDLHYPSALAGDGRTRLVVAEREAGRVQLFTVVGGGEGTALIPQDSR